MGTTFRLFQWRGARVNGEQDKLHDKELQPKAEVAAFNEGISLVLEKQFTLDPKSAVGKLLG